MPRDVLTKSCVDACNIYKNYLMSYFVNNMQIALMAASPFSLAEDVTDTQMARIKH